MQRGCSPSPHKALRPSVEPDGFPAVPVGPYNPKPQGQSERPRAEGPAPHSQPGQGEHLSLGCWPCTPCLMPQGVPRVTRKDMDVMVRSTWPGAAGRASWVRGCKASTCLKAASPPSPSPTLWTLRAAVPASLERLPGGWLYPACPRTWGHMEFSSAERGPCVSRDPTTRLPVWGWGPAWGAQGGGPFRPENVTKHGHAATTRAPRRGRTG